jgi:hypothetical protein
MTLLSAAVALVVILVLGAEGIVSWIFAGLLAAAAFRLGQELALAHAMAGASPRGADERGERRSTGAESTSPTS